jgi:hypothetical protein
MNLRRVSKGREAGNVEGEEDEGAVEVIEPCWEAEEKELTMSSAVK